MSYAWCSPVPVLITSKVGHRSRDRIIGPRCRSHAVASRSWKAGGTAKVSVADAGTLQLLGDALKHLLRHLADFLHLLGMRPRIGCEGLERATWIGGTAI